MYNDFEYRPVPPQRNTISKKVGMIDTSPQNTKYPIPQNTKYPSSQYSQYPSSQYFPQNPYKNYYASTARPVNKFPPQKANTLEIHNRKYPYQTYAKPPTKDDTKKVKLMN